MSGDQKTPCKYGADCYRQNPRHLAEFGHPPKEDGNAETGKRGAEHPDSLSPKKQPKLAPLFGGSEPAQKPILVVLPGASGALARDFADELIPALRLIFDVRVRPEGKWQGWDPSKNARAVVAQMCPKEPDAPAWFVMGASFGNRVAAAVVSEKLTLVTPTLIFTGFPLYGDKGTDERLNSLRALPASARVLCISGEKDDYITKNVPAGKPHGQALWDEVAPSLACGMTVHMVAKGTHGCFPSAKGQKKDACAQMVSWIRKFAVV